MTTLDEIQRSLTENDWVVADKKRNLACVFRQEKEIHEPTGQEVMGEPRIIKIFKALPEGGYEEVDYETLKSFMKEFLKEKTNIDDLVEEVVKTTAPGALLDAHERLKDPEIRKRARAKPGCYAIVIPPVDPTAAGETGKPMELYVR